MKFLLVGALIVVCTGLAVAQSDQSTCQDTARKAADDYRRTGTYHRPVTDGMAKLVEERVRKELIERIREQTGIGVAADCIEARFSTRDFRAQGNVALTIGDVVIHADNVALEKGEIHLAGNAWVRLPDK